MNILATLAALALSVSPDAAFEADGIRIDGTLIQGPVLQVKQANGQMLLVSGGVVEAIAAELRVSVRTDRVLVLEPGIRATRRDRGVLLSAHGKRAFSLAGHAVAGPTLVTPTADGWSWGQVNVKGSELRAALPRQENADSTPKRQETPEDAMKRMNAWSEKAREILNLKPQTKQALVFRRVVTGDPTAVGNAVDSDYIKPLPKVSPVGP